MLPVENCNPGIAWACLGLKPPMSGMEPSRSDRPVDGEKIRRLSTQSLATNQNPWTATTRTHACHTCATSNVRVMQDTAYTQTIRSHGKA